MPDLKAVNADELEQQLRDAAHRATASIAKLAEDAIADVRTVVNAQQQIGPLPATDLMLRSHVALVQDLELRPEHGTLRDLDFALSLNSEYHSGHGELRSGRLSVPPGRYRLLVFLVDQAQGEKPPAAELCMCAYAATAHGKTPQCPVVFAGLEDDDE